MAAICTGRISLIRDWLTRTPQNHSEPTVCMLAKPHLKLQWSDQWAHSGRRRSDWSSGETPVTLTCILCKKNIRTASVSLYIHSPILGRFVYPCDGAHIVFSSPLPWLLYDYAELHWVAYLKEFLEQCQFCITVIQNWETDWHDEWEDVIR